MDETKKALVNGLKNHLNEYLFTREKESAKNALDYANNLHGYREDGELLVSFDPDIGHDGLSSVTVYYRIDGQYALLQRLSDGTVYLDDQSVTDKEIIDLMLNTALPLATEEAIGVFINAIQDAVGYGVDLSELFRLGEDNEMAIALINDLKGFSGWHAPYHIEHTERAFGWMQSVHTVYTLTIRTTNTFGLITVTVAYTELPNVEIGEVEYDCFGKSDLYNFMWLLKNNKSEAKRIFSTNTLLEIYKLIGELS